MATKSRGPLIPADGFYEWSRVGKAKQPYCFEVNEEDPKDIASLCVFLTSDAGKSISGQVIPIDNGALKAS